MGKKIGVGALLILLIGISIYMWKSQQKTESDAAVSAVMEDWVCSKCGEAFQLSVDEGAAMYKAGKGVVCPKCGEGGAEKQNVKVFMGFREAPEPEVIEDEPEPEAPPLPAGGMGKKGD